MFLDILFILLNYADLIRYIHEVVFTHKCMKFRDIALCFPSESNYVFHFPIPVLHVVLQSFAT